MSSPSAADFAEPNAEISQFSSQPKEVVLPRETHENEGIFFRVFRGQLRPFAVPQGSAAQEPASFKFLLLLLLLLLLVLCPCIDQEQEQEQERERESGNPMTASDDLKLFAEF